MSERTTLNKEQKEEQVKAVKTIAELLPKISEQIVNMHSNACIIAFTNSVDNLTKKCELYNKEKEVLTPEEKNVVKEAQKKALEAFRATKKDDAISSNMEIESVKHENKKKGKR